MGESFPTPQVEDDPVAAEIRNASRVAEHRNELAASGQATAEQMVQADAAVEHYTQQAADAWEQEMVNDPDHWVQAEQAAPAPQGGPVDSNHGIPEF